MKKVFLFAAVISAFSFASCKKDYTCTCTTSYAGLTASTSTTIHDTKSKASSACTAEETSSSVGGVSATTTCVIK
jgi:hypothetical protein